MLFLILHIHAYMDLEMYKNFAKLTCQANKTFQNHFVFADVATQLLLQFLTKYEIRKNP